MSRHWMLRLAIAALTLGVLTATTHLASAQEAAQAPPPSRIVTNLGGHPDAVTLTPEEQHFVDLVNAERRTRGIEEVIVAPLLVATARDKSQEMHDLKYWGHQSPNPEKRTAMRRILHDLPETPATMRVGENLFYCSRVAVEQGHVALMNSPTHRKNILNPAYRYIGIGGFTAEDGRFWITQHFVEIAY